MSGKIKEDSPLGELLASKGITPANSNQFEGTLECHGIRFRGNFKFLSFRDSN